MIGLSFRRKLLGLMLVWVCVACSSSQPTSQPEPAIARQPSFAPTLALSDTVVPTSTPLPTAADSATPISAPIPAAETETASPTLLPPIDTNSYSGGGSAGSSATARSPSASPADSASMPTQAGGPATSTLATPGPSRLSTAPTTTDATVAATSTLTAPLFSQALDGWTITDLHNRSYGGTGIETVQTLNSTASYIRYQIRYPSDNLMISGIMTIPRGRGPFPVVILNHGFQTNWTYQTGNNYFNVYVDYFAGQGFVVLNPDYRNYGLSSCGYNPFEMGQTVDILNLIAQVKSIPLADPNSIVMFGHSRGGGLSQKVLVLTDKVKAAVLYGPVSADLRERNRINRPGRPTPTVFPTPRYTQSCLNAIGGSRTLVPFGLPLDQLNSLYDQVSPYNYLQYWNTPVSINYGELDEQVDTIRSEQLAQRLQAAGKSYELHSYPGQYHNFTGAGFYTLMQRSIAFFNTYLARKAGAQSPT